MSLSMDNLYESESVPYPLPPPPPTVHDGENRTPEEITAYRQWEETHGEVWHLLERRLEKYQPVRNRD